MRVFFLIQGWDVAASRYRVLQSLPYLEKRRVEVLGINCTMNASALKYLLRLTLFYPLHRILNVDFAKSIVILAQRRD